MLLNYKFEIFPTEEQKQTLHRWINLCCMQYNSALLDKQRAYKTSKQSLGKKELSAILTESKKRYPFLKEVPSQPLLETIDRLLKAYDKFFRKEANYPKLKSPKDYHSITFTQFGIEKRYQKYKGKPILRTVRHAVSLGRKGCLLISKLGEVKVNWHRKLDGKVRQVTIKRQNDRFFVIFTIEKKEKIKHTHPFYAVGIDMGISKYAVLSNGIEVKNPRHLLKTEKKLKKAQQKLSRKQYGSKNWHKQLQKVRKLHMKVANQRKDFLHKLSYHITKRFKYVFVEDLNIKNMAKNRKLAKHIYDAGWGMFRNLLAYKCERYGEKLMKVKPHYTSVACSNCGNHVKKSLSVRTHICPKCGYVGDRDHNASINILNKGLESLS